MRAVSRSSFGEKMNNSQRTLTFVILAAFTLTVLLAPWDLTAAVPITPTQHRMPRFWRRWIFGPWAKRELNNGIFWTWLALGIIYTGLFIAFREEKIQRPQRNSRNEQFAGLIGDDERNKNPPQSPVRRFVRGPSWVARSAAGSGVYRTPKQIATSANKTRREFGRPQVLGNAHSCTNGFVVGGRFSRVRD